MQFRREALIQFYDDPASILFGGKTPGSHVSAITGLIGEDLLLATLLHYWRNVEHHQPLHLSAPCRNPGRKGKWLDAWVVRDPQNIFQVELKNWSAHSLGGRRLMPGAAANELRQESSRRWREFFDEGKSLPPSAAKVLLPMQQPVDYDHYALQKLLCFWFAICPPNQDPISPMFDMNIGANRLHVFSASLYLRSLNVEFIDLSVARVDARLRLLDSLINRTQALPMASTLTSP